MQAEARYRSGLATLVEVAEAEQLLVSAETEESVSKLAVWKALLAAGFAGGDLTAFIGEAEKAARAK